METLISILQEIVTKAISKTFTQFSSEKADIALCLQQQFGHYQCNSALKLGKILKKSPREVAQEIISNIDRCFLQEDIFEDISIAGPGFINMKLTSSFISSQLNTIVKDPFLGVKQSDPPQKIIVEFSSPNIAKELHVGHLRSTIIGDCLARLFEFLGNDVLRLNHIGDWGTQFGMLITYLKQYHPKILIGEEKADLSSLTDWYKQAKKKFDADADFKKRSQLEVVNLQGKEKEAYNAWNIICDISRLAFEEIYGLLDVKIKERGESFYNPYLKSIVEDLQEKGLIEISDNAKCIFIEGFKNREGNPLPLMIQKSDGGFNYDTTDMAGFKHRTEEEKADRIIVVTDAGQSLHFQMIYKAAVKAKYLDPNKTEFDHVTFGLVLGPDGKKFKTREGATEKLIDLLKEAVDRAKNLLIERLPNLDEKEINSIAKALGIGAIKYADLSCHRQKDYLFSYDRMLRFEGNTAAFLLYAYVRIMGIKRKVKVNIDEIIDVSEIELEHPSEISLGFHLRRFGEVLETVSKDLLPNRLTDYLYELAENFNAFFRDCRVDGSDKQNNRLILCELTGRILQKGLNILGLKTVNRM
jgi:arginyl-tRNA synthetase